MAKWYRQLDRANASKPPLVWKHIDWLQNLTEGSLVVVQTSHHGGVTWDVQRVTRVTRTQIRTAQDTYDRVTGRRRGEGAWGVSRTLIQPTPENLQKARDQKERATLSSQLRSVAWHKQPLAVLRAVADLVEGETVLQ